MPSSRRTNKRRLWQLQARPIAFETLEDRTLLSALQILHDRGFGAASPAANSIFGEYFDANDRYIAVGAWNQNVNGLTGAGQVTVMDAVTGAVAHQLTEPTPSENGNYGISVAVDGDVLAVGSASPSGPGAVYLYELSSGELLRTILSPDGGTDMFGFAIEVSGPRLLAGAWSNTAGGRAWVFDVETGEKLSTLNNPTPVVDDFFASSVALDGTTAVISAIYDDNAAGQDAGAVYTYDVSTSGELDPIFTILNPNPSSAGEGDKFGVSISVSGENLVVGDWSDDTEGIDSGAAYVYDVNRGVLKRTLKDPIKKAGNNFGARVGVEDDIVVVGIRGADRGYVNSGAAVAFDVRTGELIRIIDNPTPGGGQFFSNSDIRVLDGAILIGSPQYGSLAEGKEGAVDRFAVRRINVTTTTHIDPNPGLSLVAKTPERDSAFGSSFESNGTFTAVGAWKATVNGVAKAGSVTVFDANGTILYDLTELVPRDEGNFGADIAVDGDLLAVGAASPSQPGRVYLYKLSTGQLLRTISSPDDGNDQFGQRLDLSGGRLLVSAFANSAGGRAWIFDASSGTILATLNNPAGKLGDGFGQGVALDGAKAVVAALYDDTAGLDAGMVYVFDAAATENPRPQLSIKNPRPSNVVTGDRFGVSIAISGSHLVIGDWANDENGADSGAAYLYDANTGEQNHFYDDPSPSPMNNFGNYVTILGNRVAVGIRGSTTNAQGGAVAIYDLKSGHHISTIVNPTPVSSDEFGSTGIQLLPNRILIGSVQKKSMIPLALGAVDVFKIDTTTEVFGTDDGDTFAVSFPTAPQGTMNLKISTPDAGFFDLGNFPVEQRLKFTGRNGSDVVKVYGTKGADRFRVEGGNLEVNGFGMSLDSFEGQTLIGDAGNDTYTFDADMSIGTVSYDESGGGLDTFDFSKTTTIGVNLDLGKANQVAVSAKLRLNRLGNDGIENLYGSAVDDQLTGNELSNKIFGLSGNDKINGATGNDTLIGGIGHDTYVFATAVGIESDVITEVVNGGVDTLDFGAVARSLTLDLGRSDLQLIESGRRLTVTNAQVENARGGQGNDVIRGNQFANQLFGNQGNDSLDGLDGDDRLSGGMGSDTANGGNGADTYVFENAVAIETDILTEPSTSAADLDFLDFSEITNDLQINLGSTGTQQVHKNRTLRLNSSTQFEGVRGGLGSDRLIGNSVNNQLLGGRGNDHIEGLGGSDVLVGGDGDDQYVFTNGTNDEFDIVDEQNTGGDDSLDFRFVSSNTILNLGVYGRQNIHSKRSLQLKSGTVIETVRTGAGDDQLWGNTANNLFDTGAGDDWMDGGPGSDSMSGGLGNDTYAFTNPVGTEKDAVGESEFAGTDWDEISFETVTIPTRLDLSTAGPQYVHYGASRSISLNSGTAIEALIGGLDSDVLIGNSTIGSSNVIYGGPGNDSLYGGDGVDDLFGEGGYDRVYGRNGDDRLHGGAGDDLIRGGEGNDAIIESEGKNVLFGDSGNDYVIGGNGPDEIRGGDGDDNVFGNGGIDTVFGDAGNDTLNGDDILNGGTGNDTLTGDAGNDTMNGGAGNDTLSGDAGNDTLNGDDGEDVVRGDAGNDTTNGGVGNDEISGDDGNDTLYGSVGDDLIDGGNGTDEIHGDTGNDKVLGGRDPDRIWGDAGHDQILGGAGIDLVYGGSGNDVIFGGADVDRISSDSDADCVLQGTIRDTMVHLKQDDAQILLENSRDRAWNDQEIEAVMEGIAKLVVHTKNRTLLMLSSENSHFDKRLTLRRVEQLGSDVLADNDSNGLIRFADYAFESSLPPWIAVIHEIGHNWDSSSENIYRDATNQLFIDRFRKLTGHVSDYHPNVKEDWCECLVAVFTGREFRYYPDNAKDRVELMRQWLSAVTNTVME